MDNIKEITLRRVQAIRDAGAAKREEERCKKEAVRLREIELFKPLRDIWESVKDLPSQSYRWHSTRRDVIPMWQHVGVARSENLEYSVLRFAGGDGNTEFTLCATTTGGVAHLERRSRDYDNPKRVTMEEAEEILLQRIARYLITDDEQKD